MSRTGIIRWNNNQATFNDVGSLCKEVVDDDIVFLEEVNPIHPRPALGTTDNGDDEPIFICELNPRPPSAKSLAHVESNGNSDPIFICELNPRPRLPALPPPLLPEQGTHNISQESEDSSGKFPSPSMQISLTPDEIEEYMDQVISLKELDELSITDSEHRGNPRPIEGPSVPPEERTPENEDNDSIIIIGSHKNCREGQSTGATRPEKPFDINDYSVHERSRILCLLHKSYPNRPKNYALLSEKDKKLVNEFIRILDEIHPTEEEEDGYWRSVNF